MKLFNELEVIILPVDKVLKSPSSYSNMIKQKYFLSGVITSLKKSLIVSVKRSVLKIESRDETINSLNLLSFTLLINISELARNIIL